MARSAEAWLVSRTRHAEAGVGLYCFPHAGGAPGEYARWSDDLPGMRVSALRLPGRGSRLHELSCTSMEELVDAVASAVIFEHPFVFFGHSLGALTAFEVARSLRHRGRPLPQRLIVSACPAPQLIAVRRPPRHLLTDDGLLTAIEGESGPLPAQVRDDPELLRLWLRAMRADLKILETYTYRPGDPLEHPISAIAGADDQAGTRMAGWREHTTGPFDMRQFTGAHFYFREHRHEVLSYVRDTIENGESAR